MEPLVGPGKPGVLLSDQRPPRVACQPGAEFQRVHPLHADGEFDQLPGCDYFPISRMHIEMEASWHLVSNAPYSALRARYVTGGPSRGEGGLSLILILHVITDHIRVIHAFLDGAMRFYFVTHEAACHKG